MSTANQAQTLFTSPEVRVVEASAGSGKTYALAKRYVQLVLKSSKPSDLTPIRSILALTFTNKAAFEMKARILEFLKTIALRQLSEDQEQDILKPLGLSTDQASKRAFSAMEGVIRYYNFFQVQTIDKFINALLSGCAFKVGLTANFKIKTNSKDYLQYSLDQLIDQAAEDPRILKSFDEFLHHYLYLENRSGWFPKDDILAIITTLFEQNNTYGADFTVGKFSQKDVTKKKRIIYEDIKKLKAILPDGTHAGFLKAINKFIDEAQKGFDVDRLSDYFAREQPPIKKGTEAEPRVYKLWSVIQSEIKLLCHAEAFASFNPYIDIFNQTLDGFKELAAKDDCLFLNELNKRARALFSEDHVTVEELYYRLATRFHHYLIDEFQDTSQLQWQNLEAMAEEALSTGGTLFYVGDRKQAIYSFRGGDAALFDELKHRFKSFNVHVDQLINNWRSKKVIVKFNNSIFSMENLDRFLLDKSKFDQKKNKNSCVAFSRHDKEVMQSVFGSAVQQPQSKEEAGYVRFEYIDIDKKEERNEVVRTKLIALIKELKERVDYKDIAILTRGNQDIKEMTNWLLEVGIPVESERTSDISENNLILEIMAFLRFLNSPIDNCAFAEFIQGKIFTQASGLSVEEMHKFVFNLRDRLLSEKDCYLYTIFREQYPDAWEGFIDEFFSNVGLYPLYELVVTVYKRLHIQDFEYAQGFFMHLLDLIKKNEEEYADLQSFLDYFDNLKGESLFVHMTDSDAVKILTIHKSKGLEFPIVILPALGMDMQIGARSGEYQPSYVLRQEGATMQLLRLKSKYRKFSPELENIYSEEYIKAFMNELNNVYVALTRPINELYGFIPKKIGTKHNDVRFLIPEDLYTSGQPQKQYERNEKKHSIRPVSSTEYPDWIEYLKDEFHAVEHVHNRRQRLKGEMMHAALEQIKNLSRIDKQEALNQALATLQQRYPASHDFDQCIAQITKMIDTESLKSYFYCGQAAVHTELECVNASGHTKRLDRVISDDTTISIVDYKSTRESEDLAFDQVNEYKELLKSIYPDKTIEGAVIYIDSMEVRQV